MTQAMLKAECSSWSTISSAIFVILTALGSQLEGIVQKISEREGFVTHTTRHYTDHNLNSYSFPPHSTFFIDSVIYAIKVCLHWKVLDISNSTETQRHHRSPLL
uniref:Uncharacterized protein n=1 Tax=Pseudictyota dubia TaxID=2749911 RepID=A0A6U2FP10_9STRA|mmetsp:Transcript_39672/g.73108  ORF Transcript_39672/g.73108 Transcript_39672/m.73108 type:complete len:104 (+) Transcript_39672:78-389(+)